MGQTGTDGTFTAFCELELEVRPVCPQVSQVSSTGRHREISPLTWVLSVLFLLRYAFLGSE